jgi:hypothetical protein
MLDRAAETSMADIVERILRDEGRRLGPRSRRDGRDASGLRVDFTYDEADQPLALEITSVVRPQDRSATASSSKLCERLSQVTQTEQLGHWALTLWADADLDRLEPLILDLMQRGEAIRVMDCARQGSLRR